MFEKIVSILADQKNIHPDTLTHDSKFEDLGFDSLDMLEFAMALESEFGITLDSAQISTVGELCDIITALKGDI